MTELIGMACAAVFGVSTLVGCLLLPRCQGSEEDVENDMDITIKVILPAIRLKRNTKSHSDEGDITLIAADYEQVPNVIPQNMSNNAFKVLRLREAPEKKYDQGAIKLSEVPQKSVPTDNSRCDMFHSSTRLIDNSQESRTGHDNSLSVRKTSGLQKKTAVPVTDSNGSSIINKELQSVSMQASIPRYNVGSLKSISNAAPELMIAKPIQKKPLKVGNSSYNFIDCRKLDDTEYYKIPAVHSKKLRGQIDRKRTYPSTSTRINSKYTVKDSWSNISQLRKRIDLFFAKIRKFL